VEIAVLVKVVPDHDALGFDPQRLHAVREGVELFVNPFDQRALRVALDLRRPGDRVSVASMGPPGVAPVLAGSYALGADRVSLVCDPALAGSDTLVTARVLTKLLGRWGSDIVLLGARSTDGETGQVPAEIAALRGVPLAGSARRVTWADAGQGLVVTSDTETGWASARVPVPCVISVGEKVAKLIHPSEEEVRRSAERSVERIALADLEIPAATVGTAGSPTRVVAVRTEDPRRAGVVLMEGTVAERVEAAMARLGAAGPDPVRRPGGPLRRIEGDRRAFVVVSAPEGRLEARALPLLAASIRSLGLPPAAVWVGGALTEGDRGRIARAGAVELFRAETPPGPVEARTAALTIERILLGRPRFEAGLFLSTHFGREIGGRVAARLGLGLTGDAVDVGRRADGAIRWTKPAFGGNAVADVVSRTAPSLATVRPGVFELGVVEEAGPIPEHEVEVADGERELERIDEGQEPIRGYGDLDEAHVAVSVGMGVGGPEGVEKVRRMIEGTGWAVAATRRVVDAGWVPRALQVGLTGRSAAPGLVVLVGVRGSPNHLVGWKRARRLLSINPDRSAPVFAGSDVGIVAPWEEALPQVVAALRPRGGAASRLVPARSP
jgi:electron transfer flavoprotein alpha subunit